MKLMQDNIREQNWLEGELKLSGIDAKMIALLQAIDDIGSISQAAKRCGLSYKGAWQIIERANLAAPSILLGTATGGNKGGGAALTEAGRALLSLYVELQDQHRNFLARLNQTLHDNPETRLLMQRLAVKTSVRNQLFGIIKGIATGAVNAKISVELTGELPIEVIMAQSSLDDFSLSVGRDAVLLIHPGDVWVIPATDNSRYTATNTLPATVLRVQVDESQGEITTMLANGETLSCLTSRENADSLTLKSGDNVLVLLNTNAIIIGVQPASRDEKDGC